jgi:hypothetical protein
MKTLKGNILPFAIVITATILLGGITLGAIVIENLKRSVDTDNSMVAYYSADAGIERQLFAIRKQNSAIDSLDAMEDAFDNGSTWESEDGSHYVTTDVKTFSTLDAGDVKFVDLYDPDHIGASAGVGQVKWSWEDPTATCKLEMGYVQWTPAETVVINQTDEEYKIESQTIGPGSLILDTTKAYRLRFRTKDCDITNLQIRVYATAGDITSKTFPGDLTIASEGAYKTSKQAIAVTMPRLDILSGVFNYVIFSECSLIKDPSGTPTCPAE